MKSGSGLLNKEAEFTLLQEIKSSLTVSLLDCSEEIAAFLLILSTYPISFVQYLDLEHLYYILLIQLANFRVIKSKAFTDQFFNTFLLFDLFLYCSLQLEYFTIRLV